MFYESTTDGIRVSAQPFYLAGQSQPDESRYVFAYRVRIENQRPEPAQLLWRTWKVHDSVGGDSEIEGEGVIGEQPTIAPGAAHEYESFCVLQGPEGHMEGSYEFRRPDGSTFRAAIPRFLLRTFQA